MDEFSTLYVGLDVHKDSIDITVTEAGRGGGGCHVGNIGMPGAADEAMRDLMRAREDAVLCQITKRRQPTLSHQRLGSTPFRPAPPSPRLTPG